MSSTSAAESYESRLTTVAMPARVRRMVLVNLGLSALIALTGPAVFLIALAAHYSGHRVHPISVVAAVVWGCVAAVLTGPLCWWLCRRRLTDYRAGAIRRYSGPWAERTIAVTAARSALEIILPTRRRKYKTSSDRLVSPAKNLGPNREWRQASGHVDFTAHSNLLIDVTRDDGDATP